MMDTPRRPHLGGMGLAKTFVKPRADVSHAVGRLDKLDT
jgi:hypothetical protein